MTPTREFLTTAEAAARAGTDEKVFARRWRGQGLATYRDPADFRKRVVALVDFERFTEPVCVRPGRTEYRGGG